MILSLTMMDFSQSTLDFLYCALNFSNTTVYLHQVLMSCKDPVFKLSSFNLSLFKHILSNAHLPSLFGDNTFYSRYGILYFAYVTMHIGHNTLDVDNLAMCGLNLLVKLRNISLVRFNRFSGFAELLVMFSDDALYCRYGTLNLDYGIVHLANVLYRHYVTVS